MSVPVSKHSNDSGGLKKGERYTRLTPEWIKELALFFNALEENNDIQFFNPHSITEEKLHNLNGKQKIEMKEGYLDLLRKKLEPTMTEWKYVW